MKNIVKRSKAVYTGKKLEKEFIRLFQENPTLTDLQCYQQAVYNCSKLDITPETDTMILRMYNEQKRVYWVEDYEGWIRKDTFTKHMPVTLDLKNFTVTKNGRVGKLICIGDDPKGINEVYEGLLND